MTKTKLLSTTLMLLGFLGASGYAGVQAKIGDVFLDQEKCCAEACEPVKKMSQDKKVYGDCVRGCKSGAWPFCHKVNVYPIEGPAEEAYQLKSVWK